jgi:putative flippase GtrA
MRKFERFLKILSLTVGTMTFGFIIWLGLIYSNFDETTAKIIGGVMIVAVLYAISRWGYFFIDD